MKKLFLLLMALLMIMPIQAQRLTVENMVANNSDLSARTYERKDQNGSSCALVKVQFAVNEARFEGNVCGEVSYKTGEYWVYMTEGSRELRIKHPNYLPLHITFSDYDINTGVKAKQTYNLVVVKPAAYAANDDDDGTSYLIMTVTPKNSIVFIDDKLQTVNDGTMRIRLSYGQHRYRVDANGYATEQGTVEIGPGRKAMNIALQSCMGTLSVNCATPGVQIYVNDQLKGTAPWSGHLPPGTYVVEGRKQGSHPQRETVSLSEQADRTVTLPALIAQVGRLDIDYQPVNVEVYLDGNLLGKSPDIFRNISVGSHEVELRYTGYTSKKERVTIEEGKTAKLVGSLSRIPSEDAEIAGKTAEQIRTIAYNYCEGKGGKSVDYAKAMKYSRIAAERGNTDAMVDIGYMYSNAQGVTRDKVEAVKWYRKAAEQGNASGQSNLGYMYRNGYGVTKDYAEAVKWYRKAAEQGQVNAQYNIGLCYQYGKGVTIDYAEAVKWYRKAAEQGDADGQNHLGYMYEKGYGVTKDDAEAVKWYRKAAEQGQVNAQYNIGLCYQYGKGVTIDLTQAKYWYEKAAEQGDEDAKKHLKDL